MSTLDPLLAGKWNGHSLWLQWTPDETAAEGYRVEIALGDAPKEAVKWKLVDVGHTMRPWMILPVWREGLMVRARVSVAGRAEPPEDARECVFTRSSCIFEFQAAPGRPLIFPAKANFHCYVDGGGCSYFTELEIHVPAGETQPVTLQALASSGWNQLDQAGDFDLQPESGAHIRNAYPSQNDVTLTGREYTIMEIKPRDGPLAVVYAPRNANVR